MKKEEKLIPDLPSGFEDRWNKKLAVKKKLINSIEANFLKYGFAPLETPSFEKSINIGSFLADDEANPMSDVFSFKDYNDQITLRYDLSSPLSRFVAQNYRDLAFPFKRYAIGNVWRNEKSGNARYREFTQADVDIIGNTNKSQSDSEICNVIVGTLLNCGLKKDQFSVSISNRKIIQGLIKELKISDQNQELKVIRAIDKLERVGMKGVEDLIYGQERIDESKRKYCVEGPLDSLFLPNCMAMAGVKFNVFDLETIIVLDNEKRNKEIVHSMEKFITKGYKVCIWPDDIQGKDINEMILNGMASREIIDCLLYTSDAADE